MTRSLTMWPFDWRQLYNAYDSIVRCSLNQYRKMGPAWTELEVKRRDIARSWLLNNIPVWIQLHNHVFGRPPAADALGTLPEDLANYLDWTCPRGE